MLSCNPAEFRTIRRSLGYSTQGLARVLGVRAGRTIRKWERGDRDIPELTQAVMTCFERGLLQTKDLDYDHGSLVHAIMTLIDRGLLKPRDLYDGATFD